MVPSCGGWWLVAGELLPYSGMEKKVLEPAASRLRLLDRIPEIPPHRAVCVARHERRLSTGQTQAELADHE